MDENEDYKSLLSAICSNALEIALDENAFDAKKLESITVKSLGTNEGCKRQGESVGTEHNPERDDCSTREICRRNRK